MPNYLEGNTADIYAMNRLGSTFSDALLGMQANRMKMQQQAAQQAMDRAYFDLAQRKGAMEERVSNADIDKLKADVSRLTAETERYKAETETKKGDEERNKADFAAASAMGQQTSDLYDLDATKYPMTAQALRGLIARNALQIAAQNPANIIKQSLMASQSADPNTGRLIATDTPAVMSLPRGATLMDVANQRPIFQSPASVSLDPNKAQTDRIKTLSAVLDHLSKSGNLDDLSMGDKVRGALGGELDKFGVKQSADTTSGSVKFDNEEAARGAGKKTGDRVYLKGIGLVELQ